MSDDQTPKNYIARGATDGDSGYVLLEPKTSDPRLKRLALNFGPSCTLIKAEEHAAHFNQGGTFSMGLGLVLEGDAIPTLHFSSDGGR